MLGEKRVVSHLICMDRVNKNVEFLKSRTKIFVCLFICGPKSKLIFKKRLCHRAHILGLSTAS